MRQYMNSQCAMGRRGVYGAALRWTAGGCMRELNLVPEERRGTREERVCGWDSDQAA